MADTVKILGQQAGDDYSTTAAAIADIPANIVTHGGDNWVIQVRADADYDGFQLPYKTTDATHRLIFEAFAGDEVDGTGAGARFKGASGATSTRLIASVTGVNNATHVDFRHLMIHATGVNMSALYLDDVENKAFESCFIISDEKYPLEGVIFGVTDARFSNSILLTDSGDYAVYYNRLSASASFDFDGCTLINLGGGNFCMDDRGSGASGGATVRNTLAYGASVEDFEDRLSDADVDYIASSDSTATAVANTTGYNSRTTADFEDYAGGDYNLAAGSSLRGLGEGGADIGATLGGAAAPSITASGTAQAQASSATGTAERLLAGSGVATSESSASSGAAEREITGSSAVEAGSSASVGSGAVGSSLIGSGAAQAGSSASNGIAERELAGSGAAQAQSASTNGAALRLVTGSGSTQAQGAESSGSALRVITGAGAATAQAALSSGAGTVGGVISGYGTPAANDSSASGTAEREVTGAGTPTSEAASAAGDSTRLVKGSGAALSEESDASGESSVSGPLAGSGEVSSGPATASGVAIRIVAGSGDCVSGPGASNGYNVYRLSPRNFDVTAENRGFVVAVEPKYRVMAENRLYQCEAE